MSCHELAERLLMDMKLKTFRGISSTLEKTVSQFILGGGGGHLPMSLALTAIGLRSSITNFLASRRISMMLFRRANSGARGKEATKRVTIPNWMTEEREDRRNEQL